MVRERMKKMIQLTQEFIVGIITIMIQILQLIAKNMKGNNIDG